jgi:hypothetical protein
MAVLLPNRLHGTLAPFLGTEGTSKSALVRLYLCNVAVL